MTWGLNPYFIWGSKNFFLAVIHLFGITKCSKWLDLSGNTGNTTYNEDIGEGGEGGGMEQYIFTIRKQHTVNKGTRVQGNGSEYFRGVVFSYSFSIYCAAYYGIWCSVSEFSPLQIIHSSLTI